MLSKDVLLNDRAIAIAIDLKVLSSVVCHRKLILGIRSSREDIY